MRCYVKNNRLIFESKDLYVIVVDNEMKFYEDYYVKNELGDIDEHKSIHGEHDKTYAGYSQYYIYKLGEEMDFSNDYIGEPTERFSIDWAVDTIKQYEEDLCKYMKQQ